MSAEDGLISIYEKYVERPDGVYYCWRVAGTEEWHCKLTGHKETPVQYLKYVTPKEFEIKYKVNHE